MLDYLVQTSITTFASHVWTGAGAGAGANNVIDGAPSPVTIPSSLLAFHRTGLHITVAYTVGGINTVLGSDTVTVPETVAGGTAMTGADTVHWY